MRTTTARAHPNIALVKYWGKADEELILPAAGSLSLTLNHFETTTTVVPAPNAASDVLELDGALADPGQTERISTFLDHVRALAGRDDRVLVRSRNSVPTGAGLASSASGFRDRRQLALAADLDRRRCSDLRGRRELVAGRRQLLTVRREQALVGIDEFRLR